MRSAGGALAIVSFLHAALGLEPVGAPDLLKPSAALPKVRDVRVLLGASVTRVRVRADDTVTLSGGRIIRHSDGLAADGVIIRQERGTIRGGDGLLLASRETLRSSEGGAIRLSFDRDGQWSDEVAYPGLIHISVGEAGGLEIINELDIERYVGCVTANEVWPTFATEAFRVQAIVTRTFVLYHMSRRPNAPFDVSATQGSQVYRGIRDDAVGRRAAEAAEYTRGIVCTWREQSEERLFCAYYSAACGGMSQSAALLGPDGDTEPLRGGVKCDYCKIAPGEAYRWGPVRLSADEVLSRLLERYPDLAALEEIINITPVEQTPAGRLVSLRITGARGDSREMLAERFRLAIGSTVVRSTDCRIRVVNKEVIFDNGRGYGHGLGLCQWGAQGLALTGKKAAEILRFYYPGSNLTRAY